jgi:hypothetical protein
MGPFAQPSTKVNVNTVIEKAAIINSENKTLWTTSTTIHPPGFIELEKDQSVDAAVAKAMTPKGDFFKSVRIPKNIPIPGQPPPVANLTTRGTVGE